MPTPAPTSDATHQSAHAPGLKRDYLSFWEVVAQSVANIAPTATPALIVPFVFADAGNGTWLAFVIATLAMLLVSVQVNQFARRSASPGALYTFVMQGMGAAWGVFSGWALIIAYVFTGAATIAGAANYGVVLAHLVVPQSMDRSVSVMFLLLTTAGSWWLAYRDIKLSTRTMLLMEFSTVSLILLVALAYFAGHPRVDAVQLSLQGVSAAGVRRGLVLAIFAYVGFESATALGHEARDPLRSIPRSVLFSVVMVSLFFILMSYTLVAAFHGLPVPLDQSNEPVSTLARLAGLPLLGVAVATGAYLSFFACTLASVNAAARVIYLMARHGVLHNAAGKAHQQHATPHVAVHVCGVVVLAIPVLWFLSGATLLDVYSNLAAIATFGFLTAYVLLSVAAPLFLRKTGGVGLLSILSAVSTVALLLIPIVGSVYPLPPAPGRYMPFVFVAMLLLGTIWFLYLRFFKPRTLEEVEQDLIQS